MAVAVDLVGFGIVLPILPIYAKRFHISSFRAALLVAAFSGASFVFSPIWGRISDRFGRKPVLLVSLAGTAVGSLLTGVASGFALLLVGRIVDGASGASVSVAQAAAADLAKPSERARLFGLLGAAFGVGFVAGPALGALAALWGPRLPFYLAAGLAALNTVIAARRLPETLGVGSKAPVGLQAGGWTGLLGGPPARLVPLLGVAFAAVVAFSGFEATFALFGQRRLGFGIASAAAVFTAVGAVIVVVQAGAVAPVVRRVGEGRTLIAGLLLNVLGLALLSAARSWAVAAPALLALTVGQGVVQTTMASVLAGRAAPGRRGRALGAQQSAGGLGRVVGPAVGGALLGVHASGWPYVAGAALTLAAAVVAVGTVRELS
ncbi:MAG TPA: MFS transporter [Acidimicrobiales bacterium]|nr:MFS transporter [Acidimicrobiales bacterium]